MGNQPFCKATANICIECERACGRCSWSAVDLKTGKIRFKPVPGWTAEKVTLLMGRTKSGKRMTETYRITDCPLFEPTKRK